MKIRLILDVNYIDGTVSPDTAVGCIHGALQHAIGNGLLSGETAAEIEDYGYDFWVQCTNCKEFVKLADENSIKDHLCD